jgi:hypothetical protein
MRDLLNVWFRRPNHCGVGDRALIFVMRTALIVAIVPLYVSAAGGRAQRCGINGGSYAMDYPFGPMDYIGGGPENDQIDGTLRLATIVWFIGYPVAFGILGASVWRRVRPVP